jgi:hypothetical protein
MEYIEGPPLTGPLLVDRTLRIENLSAESMPLAIGFNPSYQIPGVPRGASIIRGPAN